MPRARAVPALALAFLLALLPSAGHAAPTSATATTAAQPATAPNRAPAATTTLPAADLGATGVSLSRVSPVVAAPGQPLTIAGVLDVAELGIDLAAAATPDPTASPTADATASSSATDPQNPPVATVQIRAGAGRIASHEDVTDWVTSSTAATGRVLARADITTDLPPTAAQLPFAVTIEDLRPAMTGPFGVLPISIELHLPGATAPSRALHTFVGYQSVKEYVPLGLSWIAPFTLPADLLLVGELGPDRTAAWDALVGEQGTLRQRLAEVSAPGIVWALDPALLDPGPVAPTEETTEGTTGESTDSATTGATTPSSPAQPTGTSPSAPASPTLDPETGAEPGPDRPATSAERERELRLAFAADLLDAAAGRDILLLPRHDADISVLPDATESGPAAESIRSLLGATLTVAEPRDRLQAAGARVHPILWPADPVWDLGRDAAFHALPEAPTAAPWSVLTTAGSLDGIATGPTTTPSGTVILPINTDLSERASAATRAVRPTQAEGDPTLTAGLALMADSLVTLNERAGTQRHALISLDRGSHSLGAVRDLAAVLDQVPWLESGPLPTPSRTGELSAPVPPAEPTHPTTGAPVPAAPEAVLTAARAQEVHRVLEQLPTAASVRVGTGPELATRGVDTLAQLTSLRWRTAPQDWSTAYTPIAEQVTETFTGLTIPPRDIAFLADTGLMRVTVENTLADGIANATLHLSVDHPILRIENGPQPVEIGADSRSTVAFEATAIASGRVAVTAVVRAADGTYLSEPTTFTVRVSPTSDWIYWALGAVAIAVILAGLARMALRQRPSD